MVGQRIASGLLFSRSTFLRLPKKCWGAVVDASFATLVSGGDNTETIRKQSEHEMDKLSAHYRGKTLAPLLWKTQDEASSFVRKNIDVILFDCDGVLYRTPDPIFGAKECIQNMMDAGKKIIFVTNNSGVSRQQLKEKLAKTLDMSTLEDDQMMPASYSAAKFLKRALSKNIISGDKVHVIGSKGLCEELKAFGFKITGGPNVDKAEMGRQELADYDFPEHPINAVVVGHDTAFTSRKLTIANVLLQKNPGAILVATNRDSFDLVGADGRHLPMNGCIVAALECCSRRSAINVGKPSPDLAALIQEEHGLVDLSRTMFVGDRLDTDIKFAVDTGMVSALVMTGVTPAEKIIKLGKGNEEEPIPTAILAHVGQII